MHTHQRSLEGPFGAGCKLGTVPNTPFARHKHVSAHVHLPCPSPTLLLGVQGSQSFVLYVSKSFAASRTTFLAYQ